jgi:hypothetical protein
MTKNINNNTLTTQGCSLGAPHDRTKAEDIDITMQPMAKKILLQTSSLELCLGMDNLAKL